jgi:hypothetical protein
MPLVSLQGLGRGLRELLLSMQRKREEENQEMVESN